MSSRKAWSSYDAFKAHVLHHHEFLTEKEVLEKYDNEIFDSEGYHKWVNVAKEMTDVEKEATENYILKRNKISSNWIITYR